MMRVIIDFPDAVDPRRALEAVSSVMEEGKISVAGGIAHYCWLSILRNGLRVRTRSKKSENSADSFEVRNDDASFH